MKSARVRADDRPSSIVSPRPWETEATGDVYYLSSMPPPGGVHLIFGIILLLAGFPLFSGAVWARTVGVILAVISAIVTFAWLPWYPVRSITMIAGCVAVIWALTTHGRDIVE